MCFIGNYAVVLNPFLSNASDRDSFQAVPPFNVRPLLVQYHINAVQFNIGVVRCALLHMELEKVLQSSLPDRSSVPIRVLYPGQVAWRLIRVNAAVCWLPHHVHSKAISVASMATHVCPDIDARLQLQCLRMSVIGSTVL